MTNDFRALRADLLRELDHASAWDYQQALKDQAHAALAEPEPEGPMDEDLTQLLFDGFRGPIEFLCDAEEEAHLMIRSHAVDHARAVLAKWGNQ